MSLTRAAIKNNRVTFMALAVLLLGGVSSYLGMQRSESPGFIVRTAVVQTMFPGASPGRMELLVTDKLEKVIQEMPEIDFINSRSRTGVSLVFVNIKESYTEMRPIWDRLRRKVDKARGDLPEGVIGPFVNDEFGDVYGTIVTLVGEGFSYAELKDVADNVRDELLYIDQVAKVDILGAQDERVFIEYNSARLAELGLTTYQLSNIIANHNILIPGGQLRIGDERIVLEPSGNFESLEDIRRTVVSLPGSSDLVYLGDLVTVERGYVDPPSQLIAARGEPGLALAISMRDGANIITLGENVKQTIDQLQAVYPYGIEFDIVAFETARVEENIKGFVGNLMQAILLVLIVMLISLGIRTGFVVASLIPATILVSLLLMDAVGIGLDRISLASLVIALGMLVDNAIVMSESIMVKIQGGEDRLEAAVSSARELKIPLLTSSLTTSAAFLPIFLAESVVGEYTASIFKVVTIALLSSWVLSLTFIPLMCYIFIRVKPDEGAPSFDTRFYTRYRGGLLLLLRNRFKTIAAVVLIFFLSFGLKAVVPNIFFPPYESQILRVLIDMPMGTAIEKTREVAGRVDSFITDELQVEEGSGLPGVLTWATFIGQGMPRFELGHNPELAKPNYADMLLTITAYEHTPELSSRIDSFCLASFPDANVRVTPLENGPPVDRPVQFRISGLDLDVLFGIVDKVKDRLGETSGARTITDDWGARTKKLLVEINEPRARRAGVTNRDIAISLQTQLSGVETTQYREEDKVIPVTFRSVAADRQDISRLESMNVYAQMTGRAVPLRQVADIRIAWEPSNVLRRDRYRTVTVMADLEPEFTASDVNDEMTRWLDDFQTGWPVGYKYTLGGEAESSVKAQQSIVDKVPVAGFIILLLLVMQFNSFRKAGIILATIPLGLIGVIIGLAVMRSAFGFMTLLGVVSLAGIVINNAIVLLDRIQIEIEENGLAPDRAIVEASQQRLRPILLTTCTTIGGLVPLYLGGGLMFQPMAVAIAFGLMFSTLLTLGVVPVLYSLLYKIRFNQQAE